MKLVLAASAVSVAVLASGCAGPAGDATLRRDMEAAIRTAGTGAADLTRVGPREWTRMCILRPYTNNAATERVLGFKWNSEGLTTIASNDGVAVVVLATAGAVLSFAEVPRREGDFAGVQPECVPRSQALIVVQPAPDGWRRLAWRT